MIEFTKIDLRFDDKTIFQNLNIKIKPGSKVALQGKSGLGKSSFFNLIQGFILPQQGTIHVDGLQIDEKAIWEIRKRIAYIDQNISLPDIKGKAWIDSIFTYKTNAPIKFQQNELQELMAYFEIAQNDLDKNMHELSGGERQRLAIIASILLKRQIYLLDEITSSLDNSLKEKVVKFFMDNPNRTVITVSHDLAWLKHPNIKIFDLKEKLWKP